MTQVVLRGVAALPQDFVVKAALLVERHVQSPEALGVGEVLFEALPPSKAARSGAEP